MLYKDKTNGRLFLLNDSDNYGYDCYSFDKDKNQKDGFIPFCADMSCCQTKEDFDKEQELIDKWNDEMTEEEQIDYCLKGMDSSLEQCELIEDEDLEEELFDMC